MLPSAATDLNDRTGVRQHPFQNLENRIAIAFGRGRKTASILVVRFEFIVKRVNFFHRIQVRSVMPADQGGIPSLVRVAGGFTVC